MEAYDSTGWIVVSTLDLTAISNSMTIVGSKTYDQKTPIFPINIKLKQKKKPPLKHKNLGILRLFPFFLLRVSEIKNRVMGSTSVHVLAGCRTFRSQFLRSMAPSCRRDAAISGSPLSRSLGLSAQSVSKSPACLVCKWREREKWPQKEAVDGKAKSVFLYIPPCKSVF